MSRLAQRPCRTPGCPQLVAAGYCVQHAAAEGTRIYRERSADEARIYHSRRWLRFRGMVLERDPICAVCQQAAATDADHIVPVRHGGASWELENMQGLCHGCHTQKTRRESM